MTPQLMMEQIIPIRRRSLLRFFSDDMLKSLFESTRLQSYSSGEYLNRDLKVTHLHLIVQGEVILLDAKLNEIETLTQGKSLESEALFLNFSKWRYLWRTQSSSTILSIDFSALRELLTASGSSPGLWTYLQRMSTCSELYKLKRDLKLIDKDESLIQSLTVGLELTSQWSVDQFQAEKIYLIIPKLGQFKVYYQPEGPVLLDQLGQGDYFFYQADQDVELKVSSEIEFWWIDAQVLKDQLGDQLALLDVISTKIAKIKEQEQQRQEEAERLEGMTSAEEEEEDDRFDVKDFKPGAKKLKSLQRKKFYWLQQHDMMDCGAACLAMISRFYGKKINLATWRSLVHITREGASMLALKQAAEKVGFDSIGVMSGYKALMELQTPLIALMQYHFVVVYKVEENFVTVADPASQLKRMPKEEFVKEYSNNCLLLKPNKQLSKFPNSKNTFLKYIHLFKGSKLQILEVFMISVLIFILGLTPPLFLQFIFDTVLVSQDQKFLTFIALLFMGLALTSAVVEWLRTFVLVKLTSKLDAMLTSLFLYQSFRLPFSYYAVRNVGDITTRLEEIGKIREFFSSKVVMTALNILSFFLYLGILYLYHSVLLVVLAPFILILVLCLWWMIKKVRMNLHDTFRAQGKSQSLTFEQIKSLETIKSLGAETFSRYRYEEKLVELLQLNKKFEIIVTVVSSFSGLYQEMVTLLLFFVSLYHYIQGQLTLGQVMAIYSIAGLVVGPLMRLMQDWDELSKVTISMEKVDELMTSKTEPLNLGKSVKPSLGGISPVKATRSAENTGLGALTQTAMRPKNLLGDIQFQKVSFQYGNDHSPLVLNQVSLHIQRGQTVAFVGSSGSGKSTLAMMLNLLYTPTKGKIFINGQNTQDVPLEDLRSTIVMINQDNQLFAGSFLYNIALGEVIPDYERAVEAAKLADAHDFIMKKPGGYNYVLGEGGLGISGGQKQRINIARALYRSPRILIMDEATSALDGKSEKIIVENIKNRAKKLTTIIIAHRLNTIAHADYVYVFDQGQVVESGTHQELLKGKGKYFRMFKKQLIMD